jgi:2-polyprenyl-3-methyl-5-hydroxy-6-metoxy-1,4-benzoquinol methylase
MYSREEWNKIYEIHWNDAPWMSQICANNHLKVLDRFLTDVKGKRLLDYGCGNGLIAYHYYEKGAIVDMADISDNLVNWLKKRYTEKSIRIFQAATPQDLFINKYDIIIANSIIHHIRPDLWTSFLKGFADLLEPGGLLLISGWDKSEEIGQTHWAPYAQKMTWPISSLKDRDIVNVKFEIVEEVVEPIELTSFFTQSKIFTYFVFKKK